MDNKLDELLASSAGRKALMEAIPMLFVNNGTPPHIEDVPLDRVAWCASHRLNGLPKDVVDNLQTPVNLNRVVINGEDLFLTAGGGGGNHRIERFVEAGRKTIPAKVCDWYLEPATIRKWVVPTPGKEYELNKPPNKTNIHYTTRLISAEHADLFKSLRLVEDVTPTHQPPRKRRIFGFGIGD